MRVRSGAGPGWGGIGLTAEMSAHLLLALEREKDEQDLDRRQGKDKHDQAGGHAEPRPGEKKTSGIIRISTRRAQSHEKNKQEDQEDQDLEKRPAHLARRAIPGGLRPEGPGQEIPEGPGIGHHVNGDQHLEVALERVDHEI
ncbi:hypothetical protein NDU88_000750 [Pleurodeles waltl]|uniref:Uncharacterized protein n=1 Tax=Pleurodeles waltl TaxID=8319 RepID=A0AAV7VXH1_PLEWA|nr:hypothetical protein NDU88_000750 [Pleurodeles waltl]